MNIGFALCGSYCTYSQIFPVMELLTRDYNVTPIFSSTAACTDSRFGNARDHIQLAAELTGHIPMKTLSPVEPCLIFWSSPPAPAIPWQSSVMESQTLR